jgi:hypothetical protein
MIRKWDPETLHEAAGQINVAVKNAAKSRKWVALLLTLHHF